MFKQMSPNLVILSKMYQVNNGMSLLFTKLDVSMHSKHILAGTFCIIVLTNLRWWQARAHCFGHKCFPVCPRKKNVSDFLRQNILCPQQMFPGLRNMDKKQMFCVPLVCPPKKRHEQQCVGNNVSSFATTFSTKLYCHLGFCSLPPMQQIFSYKS